MLYSQVFVSGIISLTVHSKQLLDTLTHCFGGEVSLH